MNDVNVNVFYNFNPKKKFKFKTRDKIKCIYYVKRKINFPQME